MSSIFKSAVFLICLLPLLALCEAECIDQQDCEEVRGKPTDGKSLICAIPSHMVSHADHLTEENIPKQQWKCYYFSEPVDSKKVGDECPGGNEEFTARVGQTSVDSTKLCLNVVGPVSGNEAIHGDHAHAHIRI